MKDKKEIFICEECKALFIDKPKLSGWGHECRMKKYRKEMRCESYLYSYVPKTRNS